ncbi:hypothetical protein GGI12_002696 [Dipsacomyces acuminosporus]|nr:hypothetical protein GGI12_002696 [Dipsacomyces acuminosporus]
MAAREPTQFAFRSLKDVGVSNAPPAASNVQWSDKPAEEVKALKYSPNGKYLAWAISSEAKIVDAQTQAPVAAIAQAGVLDVQFSPSGTYLMTWERYSESEHAEGSHNLKVWESATGELKGTFVQKAYTGWALQWTDDEKFCAKLFPGEVRFYSPTSPTLLQKPTLTLKLEGVTAFSLSPGLSPSVAVFVPEHGGKPAIVRMYTLGAFSRPSANKTFFNAENVEFYWHKLGTNLLVLTQTEVDRTGRSYYGESSLYFMAAAGNFDCRVVLDREGPIHDVAWNPVDKEFVVTYGFMPAKTALFNHRAEFVADFGIAPRNFVRFNPHGRVLAIAGFGNLSGQVDLWDRKKLKKLGSIDAHGASFCEWGPDGRYLMAATLSPRLRVDNGIRIWHYSGPLVYRQEINELYQVDWRPAPASKFPQRSALSPVPAGIVVSDAEPKAAAKPAGAYRPPHARNRATDNDAPRSLSDMAEKRVFGVAVHERVVPGASPKVPVGASPEQAAKTGAKSQRKSRKKTNGAVDKSEESENAKPLTEVDVLKKIRALKKKMGQIDSLVSKRDSGEKLEANQLAKIDSKAQLEGELEQLSTQLAKLSTKN